jgi:hypothetical protein
MQKKEAVDNKIEIFSTSCLMTGDKKRTWKLGGFEGGGKGRYN